VNCRWKSIPKFGHNRVTKTLGVTWSIFGKGRSSQSNHFRGDWKNQVQPLTSTWKTRSHSDVKEQSQEWTVEDDLTNERGNRDIEGELGDAPVRTELKQQNRHGSERKEEV
jgi:hypothetical protein